jgi:Clp amino terminal domain, pathogenicity island component
MGDSHLGVEHALLAMIRSRDTIPARALADLADLDVVDAAVVQAKNVPRGPSPDAVYLPKGQQLDGALRAAIIGALPDGTTFGFNHDADQQTWVCVLGPTGSDTAITRQVLNEALASLGRPTVGG